MSMLSAQLWRRGYRLEMDRTNKLECAEKVSQWADGTLTRLHTKISIFLIVSAFFINQESGVIFGANKVPLTHPQHAALFFSFFLSIAALIPSFLSMFSSFYLSTWRYADPISDADATLRLFSLRARLHNTCVLILIVAIAFFFIGLI
jgi:hypothetical protein